jgi:hypothetical protein
MTSAYVVSDLARQRREVVDAARREPVRIRDADGVMLVLKTEEHDLVSSKILDYYELHARAEIECLSSQIGRLAIARPSLTASLRFSMKVADSARSNPSRSTFAGTRLSRHQFQHRSTGPLRNALAQHCRNT